MTNMTTTIPPAVLDAGFLAYNCKIPGGMRWHLALTEKRAACGETLSSCQRGGEGHKMPRDLLCQNCLTLFEATGRVYDPATCTCGKC